MCVCLSASISLEPLDRSSRKLYADPCAVARSSSGGFAIRYVLPVLWMTSRLAVIGGMAKHELCNCVNYLGHSKMLADDDDGDDDDEGCIIAVKRLPRTTL